MSIMPQKAAGRSKRWERGVTERYFVACMGMVGQRTCFYMLYDSNSKYISTSSNVKFIFKHIHGAPITLVLPLHESKAVAITIVLPCYSSDYILF